MYAYVVELFSLRFFLNVFFPHINIINVFSNFKCSKLFYNFNQSHKVFEYCRGMLKAAQVHRA